jgi:hypothetical protein
VFTVGIIPALNGKLPSTGIDMTNFDFTGVQLSAIICFCLFPMAAWLITLIVMNFYKLSGPKLREIQAVNSVRKAAISGGMPKEQAMSLWTTIDQVPAEYVQKVRMRLDKKTGLIKKDAKENILDRIYHAIWGKNEKITADPSINAIPIPEQYRQSNIDTDKNQCG